MTQLEAAGIVGRHDEPHLSFSQLQTYLDCGVKFKLSYIDRVEREPQGALIGGSLVHRIIELSEREEWWTDEANFASEYVDPEGNVDPPGVAIRAYQHGLESDVAAAGGADRCRWGGRGDGEDYTWWRKQGEFMLRRYQATREAMDGDGWDAIDGGTEMRVEANLPGVSTPVVGYLDKFLMHADGEPVIVDWKTGRIGNADPRQFATYSRLILETTGVVVEKGVAVFLRAADAGRRVGKVNFAKLVERMPESYADLVRGIEAGIFAPRPSDFCKSCSVRASCWYWQATNPGGGE